MFRLYVIVFIAFLFAIPGVGKAGERKFTYSNDSEILPEGTWEAEQWITHENGRDDGDFARWKFRSELEYGISERLQTALYMNLESERYEGVTGKEDYSDTDFKGFSTEWMYQVINPIINPVGLALYTEYTTDGIDQELENKIIISKDWGQWSFAFNSVYEAEWEKEDGETEKEATLLFTAGLARRIAEGWTGGLEVRQKSAYPDGLDLNGQEYQAVNVGPVVHYANKKFWATLTVFPQVWGNGDGASGNRQLVHEEKMEIRFLIGTFF